MAMPGGMMGIGTHGFGMNPAMMMGMGEATGFNMNGYVMTGMGGYRFMPGRMMGMWDGWIFRISVRNDENAGFWGDEKLWNDGRYE